MKEIEWKLVAALNSKRNKLSLLLEGIYLTEISSPLFR